MPVPGATQILLEVSACGVCRTDLHIVDGDIRGAMPIVPGHEVVGRVVAKGDDVSRFALGDRVGIPWLGSTCGRCKYCQKRRENLCDDPGPDAIRWFCNEQLAQGRPDQDGKPGTEYFLTRKLWDVGNTAPYGHRGDISTITEAILVHGGEARVSRDAFASIPVDDQRALVSFLKSLQAPTD